MTFRAFSPWRMTTMPPTRSPVAVQVGDAAADLRARARRGRRPAAGPACRPRRSSPRSARGRRRLLRVAAAAHHVLACRANSSSRPPTSLLRAPDGLDDLVEREVVGGEPVGVDRDLVLLDEAADRGDLRHAGHRLERVAQRPVLVGAQLGRASACPSRSTSAYWKTQPTPVASGPSSVCTPSGRRAWILERYSSTRERAQ